MSDRPSYKQTLMDRLGPDGGVYLKAMGHGAMAGGASIPILMIGATQLRLSIPVGILFIIVGFLTVTAAAAAGGVWITNRAGEGTHRLLAGGNTTPYTVQHSYQQALVMQGRLPEALASLEAIIAEPESTVDVRIRAAELYTREAKNHQRAAELFREAMRHPLCTAGEEAYSVNRLVDLLNGPLQQPGRALVELRRLADRYPDSVIGQRALAALRSLKALKREQDALSG
jgi:hypothetical protein